MNSVAPIPQQTPSMEADHLVQKSQQRYKSILQLSLIASTYALGNFYFGYSIVYMNSLDFSTIITIYHITLDQDLAQGLLVGCIPIGAAIGAVGCTLLLRNFTRRQCILIVNATAFIVGLLLFIDNFFVLLVMRLIQGLCVGAYSTFGPVFIKQISPVQISGKLGIMSQFFITFGVFFAYLYKFILSKATGDQPGMSYWIFIFGFTLLTIILQTVLLLFVFNFETPTYLIEKDMHQQAKRVISLIYKTQFVEQVYQQKLIDSGKKGIINLGLQQSKQKIETSNKRDQSELRKQNTNQVKSTPYKVIFLACHLSLLQQFSSINAVIVYGGDAVSRVYTDLKEIFPIIINFIQWFACFIAYLLLARVGRKVIFQVGTFTNAIMTVIVATGFVLVNNANQAGPVLVLVGLLLFMINFAVSLGPVVWLYIPQIVQPKIVTLATAVNWIGASLVMFLFPIIRGKLLDNNPAALFYFFSGWSLLALPINQLLIVQTKDKTQKQIRQTFQLKEL